MPPGEEPLVEPDLEAHQLFVAEWLMAATDRLTEADKKYDLQKGETGRLRRARDERARELYETWVPIRKMLSRQYPRAVLFHLLGYEGKTPREPMPLLSVCRVIVERARDEAIELPPPRLGVLKFSREGLAARLEPRVLALEQAIEVVLLAGRDEDVLLMERDQAWAKLRQVKTGISLFLEGLYMAAHLHDLVPGIRNPRGSAARRKAGAVRKPQAVAPQKVAAVEDETTAPHRKMAGAFLETTAAHQIDGRFEGRTTAPHHIGGAVEDGTTAAHHLGGAVEDGSTAAHAFDGGFEDPETPSPRPARALRLVKTAVPRSAGAFGKPEPADHLPTGGFGDLSSAEHGSVGAVGELPSPAWGSVGGAREPDSAEAGSERGLEELTSPGAGSDGGVEELKSAAAGSGGRFWHATTLRRVARRLVQGVRG